MKLAIIQLVLWFTLALATEGLTSKSKSPAPSEEPAVESPVRSPLPSQEDEDIPEPPSTVEESETEVTSDSGTTTCMSGMDTTTVPSSTTLEMDEEASATAGDENASPTNKEEPSDNTDEPSAPSDTTLSGTIKVSECTPGTTSSPTSTASSTLKQGNGYGYIDVASEMQYHLTWRRCPG